MTEGRERQPASADGIQRADCRTEGSEGVLLSPVDLPAPVVGSVPRVGTARGTDHLPSPEVRVWAVVSDPVWTHIQGPDVAAVAFSCYLAPRPVPELADTWKFPTCLVPPVLVAATRAGVDVRLKQPSPGLDVIPGPLGGIVLRPVVPEAAPGAVREGVRRLRVTAEGRPCPCGAPTTVDLDDRRVTTMHGAACPAAADALRAAAQSWLGV